MKVITSIITLSSKRKGSEDVEYATTVTNTTYNHIMIPYLSLQKVTASHLKEIESAITKTIESGWYLKGEATERFEHDYANT